MKHLDLFKHVRTRQFLTAVLLLAGSLAGQAQTHIEYNSTATISNGTIDEYNYVVIGPDAVLTIAEDWYLLAQYIYIHPSATITGGGNIHVMSPSVYGNMPAGATMLDGGGVEIGAKFCVENPDNVELASLNTDSLVLSRGYTDAGGGNTDDMVMGYGNNLNFGAVGGDIILNNHNLWFSPLCDVTFYDFNPIDFPGDDPEPPALPNEAFIVTNGTGHVVRKQTDFYFKFHVGCAEGDYTPITLWNPSLSANVFVQVKNYASSASYEQAPSKGMDRSWHIYSTQSLVSNLMAQHDTITEGSNYPRYNAWMVQFTGGTTWIPPILFSGGSNGVGDYVGSILSDGEFQIPSSPDSDSSWISKSGDYNSPLYDPSTDTTSKATSISKLTSGDSRSISRKEQKQTVRVTPTITRNGLITVSLPSEWDQVQFRLIDESGRLFPVQANGSGGTRTIQLPNLNNGQYFLQLIHKGTIRSFPIMNLK